MLARPLSRIERENATPKTQRRTTMKPHKTCAWKRSDLTESIGVRHIRVASFSPFSQVFPLFLLFCGRKAFSVSTRYSLSTRNAHITTHMSICVLFTRQFPNCQCGDDNCELLWRKKHQNWGKLSTASESQKPIFRYPLNRYLYFIRVVLNLS